MHSRLSPAVHAVRDKSGMLFDLLDAFLQESGESVLRLTDDFATHPIWRAGLRVALDDTAGEIELLADGLQLVRERFESANRPSDDPVMPLLNEMRAVTRRLQVAGDGCAERSTRSAASRRCDGSKRAGRDRAVSVSIVPLDLAPILREDLFKRATTTDRHERDARDRRTLRFSHGAPRTRTIRSSSR